MPVAESISMSLLGAWMRSRLAGAVMGYAACEGNVRVNLRGRRLERESLGAAERRWRSEVGEAWVMNVSVVAVSVEGRSLWDA